MKKYFNTFSIVGALTLMTVCYFQQKENAKLRTRVKQSVFNVDSLIYVNDSLSNELFPIEIELNRYQVAFKIFAERNPEAAYEYGTIISEETE